MTIPGQLNCTKMYRSILRFRFLRPATTIPTVTTSLTDSSNIDHSYWGDLGDMSPNASNYRTGYGTVTGMRLGH